MRYNILQANGGDKDSGQMIMVVENRARPSGLEKREDGSFKTLTWSCTLHMLARRGNTVKGEEMDWARMCQVKLLTFSSFLVLFHSGCSIFQ